MYLHIPAYTHLYQPSYVYISTFDCSYLLILIYSSRKLYYLNLLPTEICISVLSRLKILFFLRLVYFTRSVHLSIYLPPFRGGYIYKCFFSFIVYFRLPTFVHIRMRAHTYSACFFFFRFSSFYNSYSFIHFS